MLNDTRPCARCNVAPRNSSNVSYCVECKRALDREATRRRGGKKFAVDCSRCGLPRTGRHQLFCVDCYRLYRAERSARPCARCGLDKPSTDNVSANYCYSCWRGWWIEKHYGITGEQYDSILTAQDHRCAICRQSGNGRTWHVDHDHATGRVRGVLCDLCNRGLGHFRDDAALLRRAADYLEAPRVS